MEKEEEGAPEMEEELLNPHTLQLQYWTEEEAVWRRAADMEEEIYRTGQKELHRLFAMFAVFQGVLFSAVIVLQQQQQSTMPTTGRSGGDGAEAEAAGGGGLAGVLSTTSCSDAFLPIALSLVVSALASAMALVHKMCDLSRMRREIARNRYVADSIYGLMESLGAGAIDLKTADVVVAAAPENPPSLCHFQSYLGMDLLLFLVCFTVLMVVCCTAILCRKCECHMSQAQFTEVAKREGG